MVVAHLENLKNQVSALRAQQKDAFERQCAELFDEVEHLVESAMPYRIAQGMEFNLQGVKFSALLTPYGREIKVLNLDWTHAGGAWPASWGYPGDAYGIWHESDTRHLPLQEGDEQRLLWNLQDAGAKQVLAPVPGFGYTKVAWSLERDGRIEYYTADTRSVGSEPAPKVGV